MYVHINVSNTKFVVGLFRQGDSSNLERFIYIYGIYNLSRFRKIRLIWNSFCHPINFADFQLLKCTARQFTVAFI